MPTICEQYMNEMNQQYHYFATWEPGTQLNIGDIGTLDNNQFTYISSLSKKSIPFIVRKDPSKSELKYASNSKIKIKTKLAGNVGIPKLNLEVADAGMVVEFGSENGVVFEAGGVEHQMIEEVDKLDQAILKSYKKKEWIENWTVISDLMIADSGTVLISQGRNAVISLKAKANVPKLNLANVDANFDVVYQNGMNTNIICQAGLTPLFRLRGIKKPLFGETTVGAKTKALPIIEKVTIEEKDFKPF